MAIRDFGTSLLANVRARKDAGQAEARKYASSEKNKDMRFAFLSPIVSSGLGAIGSYINAGTAQKTQDFLNSSNLYDSKIKVNKAGMLITEATKYETNAKIDGVSIYDKVLQETANQARTQYQISNPNEIKAGEEEEWEDHFMSKGNIQEIARSRSAYYKDIIAQRETYNSGKNKTTLEALAANARPKTFVGSMWNKVIGNETSVDVFNTTIKSLEQVVAANKIEALTFGLRAETAKKIIASGGDPSTAKLLIGSVPTKAERVEIKKMLKLGETFEESTPSLTTNDGNVIESKIKKITEQGGNIRIERTNKIIFKKEDAITPEQLNTSIGRIPELYKMIADGYNDAGQTAFKDRITELSQDKKLTPALINSFWLEAVKGDFAPEGSDRARLAPELQASLVDALNASTKNLQGVIAANLGKTDSVSKQNVTDAQRTYEEVQTRVMNAISTRTGLITDSVQPIRALNADGSPLADKRKAVDSLGRTIVVVNGFWVLEE